MICLTCYGTGQIPGECDVEFEDTPVDFEDAPQITCHECNGTGYAPTIAGILRFLRRKFD